MRTIKTSLRKSIAYVLRLEAQLVLWKYKPKIVSITGSVGKTSTKDAVYAVLSKVAYVRKSEKSYNSEIGLPLTILGVPNAWSNPLHWLENILRGIWLFIWPHKYPKWLVLEVGVGKPGDMKRTASWLHSDVVIITGIGDMPAHIEFFSSHKHLVDEKGQLIKTLKKDGVLVLNGDDKVVLEMKEKTKNIILTYGFEEGADILGSGENISYNQNNVPEGVIFRADIEGTSLPVVIDGVFGRNHMYASLAGLAMAHSQKFNLVTAISALKSYDVPPGRMRLLTGINNSLLIDDTYNSSPLAAKSALKTLGEVKNSGRRIAVLGDMLELGRHTIEAHKNIGKLAGEVVDALVVVGPRAQAIREGALEEGMKEKNTFEFAISAEAGEFLKGFVKDGDLVLIKGSQGIRMERIVEALLADQNNREHLLVRQDEEWKNKK